MARYLSFAQTAKSAPSSKTVTLEQAIDLRTSEAPYEIAESKSLLDAIKDAVKAEYTTVTFNDGSLANRVKVTRESGRTITLRLFHKNGDKKGSLQKEGTAIDLKKAIIGTCSSDGAVVTDTMVQDGVSYKAPRLYLIVD